MRSFVLIVAYLFSVTALPAQESSFADPANYICRIQHWTDSESTKELKPGNKLYFVDCSMSPQQKDLASKALEILNKYLVSQEVQLTKVEAIAGDKTGKKFIIILAP